MHLYFMLFGFLGNDKSHTFSLANGSQRNNVEHPDRLHALTGATVGRVPLF